MGAEGTGVAKEAEGPMDKGTELVIVEIISALAVVVIDPEAIRERFSKISKGED